MLLLAMSSTILIPLAAFGGAMAIAWLAMDWLGGGKKSRVEERLDDWRDPSGRRGRDESKNPGDAMSRVLEKATPALAKPLQPKTEKEVGKLKQRLMQAGFRSQEAPTIFLGLKFLCLMLGLVLGGGGILMFGTKMQTMLN